MNQYEIHVQQIMRYLLDRKLCLSSRISHQKCYDALSQFLTSENLGYSEENADKWLETLRTTHSRQECYFWRQYIQQLNEFIANGSISDEQFYQIRSFYEKVPKELKVYLDQYLLSCQERYSPRSFELVQIYCARIMTYFYNRGIRSPREISFDDIDSLYSADFHCGSKNRSTYLSHARKLFRFLAENSLCPAEYSMLLDDRIHKQVGDIRYFSDEHRRKLAALRDESRIFPPEEFMTATDDLRNILQEQGYRQTQLKSLSHILKAFYLFILRNDLGYHPEIAWIWFEEIRDTLGPSWKNWRRILKIFQQYTEDGYPITDSRYVYKPDLIESFPEWCQYPVKGFLTRLLREFRSKNTARNYKFSFLRFCRWLIDKGFHSFLELTLKDIREFSTTDPHETPHGRASCHTVVKQFIRYLEEQNLVQQGLHNGLLLGSAPDIGIVDILTDEQLQKIREYRAAASTPMELRTAAIVMTGLGLGLRASDVVNLKLQDINWKNRWIMITQAKTGADLKLPLPNETGNSLYRYIRFGRPVIDSEFVFIHHKAPYGKLTTKICNNALYKILPERCDVHHKGFHVTRRTFATNILRKGAGISAIMDSLGHTDSTSVMKYLSFDEERMRQCTLTLKECGIELEGGLK